MIAFETFDPLTKSIARQLNIKRDWQDLRQEAYLKYLEAIQKEETERMTEEELTKYLMKTISYGLRDYIKNSYMVGFRASTLRRHMRQGKLMKLPEQEALFDTPMQERPNSVEMLEGLLRVIETDEEYEFVELRGDGYTIREIAVKLDISASQVMRIQKRLRARLRDRFNVTSTG